MLLLCDSGQIAQSSTPTLGATGASRVVADNLNHDGGGGGGGDVVGSQIVK